MSSVQRQQKRIRAVEAIYREVERRGDLGEHDLPEQFDVLIDDAARILFNLPDRPPGNPPYGWLLPEPTRPEPPEDEPEEEESGELPRRISQAGLELIKHFEGLRLCAYLDPVGVWTIGYGHTKFHARPGNCISEPEAEEILRNDVEVFEAAVSRLVKVPLTQNQFDALVSFAFNVGVGALERSTLLKKLNAGNCQGAAAEFPRWVYAGGRRLPGLVRRRAAEKEIFLSGSER